MFVANRPFVSEDSKLEQTIQMGSNRIKDSSCIASTIVESVVLDSYLGLVHTYDSIIESSAVLQSVIETSKLVECSIESSDISGATLIGVKASDITVHRGVWARAPIKREVETDKEVFVVTECTDGHVDINCMCHKAEKWLGGAGDRYLRMRGFSEEDAEALRKAVKEVMNERDRLGREGN